MTKLLDAELVDQPFSRAPALLRWVPLFPSVEVILFAAISVLESGFLPQDFTLDSWNRYSIYFKYTKHSLGVFARWQRQTA